MHTQAGRMVRAVVLPWLIGSGATRPSGRSPDAADPAAWLEHIEQIVSRAWDRASEALSGEARVLWVDIGDHLDHAMARYPDPSPAVPGVPERSRTRPSGA